MVMELFSRQYRAMAGCVIEAFWALGVILLAVIAKYVQHWRYIQLAINIPTMATIFYIWEEFGGGGSLLLLDAIFYLLHT